MGDLDIERPNSTRIYDYLLGGSFNFAVDRAFAHELLARAPWARDVVRHNRRFLARAIRYCVEQGVRQFVDLGSGILTGIRTDEIAVAADPRCRVVYVDNDPIAVAHAEVSLTGLDHAVALRADLRDVRGILGDPSVGRLLDPTEPVALLMGAVLHLLTDRDDPAGAITAYRKALPAGSMLALTHATSCEPPGRTATPDRDVLNRDAPDPLVHRTREEITELFDGWDLADPGVVFTAEWRPTDPDELPEDPSRAAFLAGVATKSGV